MKGWKRSEVTIDNGIKFYIYSNIPENKPFILSELLDRWLNIAKEITASRFVQYINSHTVYTAHTEKGFKKIFSYEIKKN